MNEITRKEERRDRFLRKKKFKKTQTASERRYIKRKQLTKYESTT